MEEMAYSQGLEHTVEELRIRLSQVLGEVKGRREGGAFPTLGIYKDVTGMGF